MFHLVGCELVCVMVVAVVLVLGVSASSHLFVCPVFGMISNRDDFRVLYPFRGCGLVMSLSDCASRTTLFVGISMGIPLCVDSTSYLVLVFVGVGHIVGASVVAFVGAILCRHFHGVD